MVYKTPFTSVKLSKSTKYLMAGTTDGAICVRPFRVKEMLLNNWKSGHQSYELYAKEYLEEVAKLESINSVEEDSRKLSIGIPGQYYLFHVHDCIEGSVTAVQTSFDDSFISSSSTDGSLFILKLGTESQKKNEGK
jgi:hypothetical protein